MKTENKLPHAPHEFMELALADLEKCEASSKYHIDMTEWHTVEEDMPSDDDGDYVCAVCLAGSVMAQTLELDRDVSLDFDWKGVFSALDEAKLEAINCFRAGVLTMGLPMLVNGTVDSDVRLPTGQKLHHIYAMMNWEVKDDVMYDGELRRVPIHDLYDYSTVEFKSFIREQVIPELKRLWDDALAKSVPA